MTLGKSGAAGKQDMPTHSLRQPTVTEHDKTVGEETKVKHLRGKQGQAGKWSCGSVTGGLRRMVLACFNRGGGVIKPPLLQGYL